MEKPREAQSMKIEFINTAEYVYEVDYFRMEVKSGRYVYCNFYKYPVKSFQQIVELLSYLQAVISKRTAEGKVTIGGGEFHFKTVTKQEKKVHGKDIIEWSLRCSFNGKEEYLDYRQCYTIVLGLQKCLQFFTARPEAKRQASSGK